MNKAFRILNSRKIEKTVTFSQSEDSVEDVVRCNWGMQIFLYASSLYSLDIQVMRGGDTIDEDCVGESYSGISY